MSSPLERISDLLGRCGRNDAVLPPTALFNEGWMLRLVLDWTERHRDAIGTLRFEASSRWYSEPLLPSRFRPRRRGDPAGEGFTHADGVIGHFIVRQPRGDLMLLRDARQLTVIEAKMASGLSLGTKRAPTFNQAARNVACIAHLVQSAGIAPQTMRLRFVVIAPKQRIAEGLFKDATTTSICEAVTSRAAAFDEIAVSWCNDHFGPVAKCCSIDVVAWEHILEEIERDDGDTGQKLRGFYDSCLRFNGLGHASSGD
jgi:hypothetical protein